MEITTTNSKTTIDLGNLFTERAPNCVTSTAMHRMQQNLSCDRLSNHIKFDFSSSQILCMSTSKLHTKSYFPSPFHHSTVKLTKVGGEVCPQPLLHFAHFSCTYQHMPIPVQKYIAASSPDYVTNILLSFILLRLEF